MSKTDTAATGLTTQYAAQVATDLENNLKAQERISGEVASLQEQLASLQQDHAVLVNVQQALGVTAAPQRPATGRAAKSVPAPRKKAPAKPAASKRTPAKKSAAPARTATAGKATPKQDQKDPKVQKSQKNQKQESAPAAAQPTLVEIVREHLAAQKEPRSAAEIATELGRQHPDRSVKTTVVRTTLEGLVAKNQAQRSKQGTSVFYTAHEAAEAAPAAEQKQDQNA
ncbi:hypothetical protein ABZ858_14895 [Streptomyces sp. NPDC047017]|uniref:hypothetical protein n=1 Tax=Streptomyces sp. NPDC047017 TaxID=3155024 RepID=UPI0033CAB148